MLDEAIAKLDDLLCPPWSSAVADSDKTSIGQVRVWTPTALAIRAAVRDVALAAAREARDTGLPHTQAEIERQFGLPEGSERGKE